MSNTWMVLNIIVLLGLIIYVIRYKRSPKKQHNQKKEGHFRIYEGEADTQMRHFRRGNFITSHPNDTDRCGESYDEHQWRFTMPHTAVDMLIECFSQDEEKAYQMKRAIELSIEHYTRPFAPHLCN
jgi:hypothetical protein